jgi:hypothetical protein
MRRLGEGRNVGDKVRRAGIVAAYLLGGWIAVAGTVQLVAAVVAGLN